MTDEARAGEPRQRVIDFLRMVVQKERHHAPTLTAESLAWLDEREVAAAPALDVERLAGWLQEDYAAEAATSGGNPFSTRRPHEFVATRLLSRLSEKVP